MPKPVAKSRPPHEGKSSGRAAPGRPPRPAGRERRQIVVDTALLDAAMRLTRQGQSDTVNAALAEFAENAAIVEGLAEMFGAFPNHPGHGDSGH